MIEPPLQPGKDGLVWSVTLAVSFTLLTLGWLSWVTFRDYRFVTGRLPAISHMEELRGQILFFDEALSMSARMAAATGDPQWEARYRRTRPQLDQALNEAMRLAPAVTSSQATARTEAANARLVAMENRAFELVRQGQQAGARQVLSSGEYESQKRAYAAGMAEFRGVLRQTISSMQTRRQVQVLWSVVTVAISTPLLIMGWWFVLQAARRWQTAILESNRQLNRQAAERDRFFTLSLDMLCIAGMDGYFKRLSPAFHQTLGYTTEELRARPFLDFVHPDDRSATLAEVAKLGQGVPTIEFENRYRCQDGSWRWLSWKAQPVVEEGLLYATARDITDRKRAEAHLVEVADELTAFKAALDEHAIVAVTDAAGKITYVNDKFCVISKYAREELIGQDHRLINSGHHPKAFVRDLWRTISSGRVWHGEIKNRAKDGTFYWVATTIVPFLDEHGQPVQYIAIRADITERKQAEEEISQLNADLQVGSAQLLEANKELESFTYSVSHDLRAPLRHVHGYIEMLQRATGGQLSGNAQRYVKTISDASTEMGRLIDDLLAFSRLGRAEVRESRVDLNASLQDVMRGLEMTTTGRNIVWQLTPLPAVVGDPSMLKQVLANLVDNAAKYSRRRDPARIEIGSAGEEDGRIVLFVRDNGAGFDMQYAHKLFGVFQRLHRAEEFEGTGIGLATVRRIVARHGGRVWADGALDQGATFYFTLKRSPAA